MLQNWIGLPAHGEQINTQKAMMLLMEYIRLKLVLRIGQEDVESCPHKYDIFRVIRTWEAARRSNAFPENIKKLLQNPALSWRLEEKENGPGWILYQMEEGKKGRSFELFPKE